MIFSAAAAPMARPVAVPPVNDTFPTPGWRTIASPTVRPGPGSTDSRPGGSPASPISRPSASDTSGVHSAGLSTTALPAASAGAIFCASLAIGEFHGVIAPTTPTGSCTLIVKYGPRGGVRASSIVSSAAAK
jgi:hypothetical protein